MTTLQSFEYRGRRRHQMITMMMFGIVSIGMVFIPMGFQFLAVLGGKALLLAKMALILASIQGLKKIAASPINYGFYGSYPYDHFERSRNWPPSVPRSSNQYNTFTEAGDIEAEEKINVPESVIYKTVKNNREIKRKINGKADKEETRQFPDNTESVDLPHSSVFAVVDAPSPLVDLTTRPGEVQADYALELPYNGFHFQASNPVVPA